MKEEAENKAIIANGGNLNSLELFQKKLEQDRINAEMQPADKKIPVDDDIKQNTTLTEEEKLELAKEEVEEVH